MCCVPSHIMCSGVCQGMWCVPRHVGRVMVSTKACKVCSGVYHGMWCVSRHMCVVAWTKVSVYSR